MQAGKNNDKLKPRLSKSSPLEVKMLVEFIRRGIQVKVKSKSILRSEVNYANCYG
jgi:hypothetical protein